MEKTPTFSCDVEIRFTEGRTLCELLTEILLEQIEESFCQLPRQRQFREGGQP